MSSLAWWRCAVVSAGLLGLIHVFWNTVSLASAEDAERFKFSVRCLMISPNEGCAIADVDNDGRPDIVAGTHWYAAPDFVPRPVRDIPQVSLGFGSLDFYANNADLIWDVDGDGWKDVISGGWTESEIMWYRNPGKVGLSGAGNGSRICWLTLGRRTRRFICSIWTAMACRRSSSTAGFERRPWSLGS
jgi:hypothetical protein